MGMSSKGANDLIDGNVVYGSDAEIFRQICSLIFIQCTSCENMIAIDHDMLFDAVIYLPDDDLIVSWCPECDGFCEASVTTLIGSQVINL